MSTKQAYKELLDIQNEFQLEDNRKRLAERLRQVRTQLTKVCKDERTSPGYSEARDLYNKLAPAAIDFLKTREWSIH